MAVNSLPNREPAVAAYEDYINVVKMALVTDACAEGHFSRWARKWRNNNILASAWRRRPTVSSNNGEMCGISAWLRALRTAGPELISREGNN